MAKTKKSPKISRAQSLQSTAAKKKHSSASKKDIYSEKPRGAKRKNGAVMALRPPKGRTPLVEELPVQQAQRIELINLSTTNTNIVQQLRMMTSYPFGIPDDAREMAVDVAMDAMKSESHKIATAGAGLIAAFLKVNTAAMRAVATDQLQRHIGFDKVDVVHTQKMAALESMSDEELEMLEKVSVKMGGAVPIKEVVNDASNN